MARPLGGRGGGGGAGAPPPAPPQEWGRLLLEAEELARAWARSRSTANSAVILRFAGLYGPGRIVRRSLLERGEPIPGDPDKFLNLIHVEDAARAAAAALEAGDPQPLYLVTDDRPVTRREYYSQAAEILHAPPPRFITPPPGSPEAARDATSKRVSNRRMKRGLGVSLLYPDIAKGLTASLRPEGRAH